MQGDFSGKFRDQRRQSPQSHLHAAKWEDSLPKKTEAIEQEWPKIPSPWCKAESSWWRPKLCRVGTRPASFLFVSSVVGVTHIQGGSMCQPSSENTQICTYQSARRSVVHLNQHVMNGSHIALSQRSAEVLLHDTAFQCLSSHRHCVRSRARGAGTKMELYTKLHERQVWTCEENPGNFKIEELL